MSQLDDVEDRILSDNDFEEELASEAISKLLAYDFGIQFNALLENADHAFKDFNFDAAVDFLNQIIAADAYA